MKTKIFFFKYKAAAFTRKLVDEKQNARILIKSFFGVKYVKITYSKTINFQELN